MITATDTSSRDRRAEWAALTPAQRAARLAPMHAATLRRWKSPKAKKRASEQAARWWAGLSAEARSATCARMSTGDAVRWDRPGERERNSEVQRRRFEDPKERRKDSLAIRRAWKDPARAVQNQRSRDGLLKGTASRWTDPAQRARASVRMRERAASGEFAGRRSSAKQRRTVSRLSKLRWQDPTYREKHTAILVAARDRAWADPVKRAQWLENMKGKTYSESQRRKNRRATLRLFRDKAWVKKWVQSTMVKPNRAEVAVLSYLNGIGLGQWRFNTARCVGGKIPDFVRTDRRRVAVDLFGDHWHQGDSSRKRQSVFRAHGWHLAVVWLSEFTRDPMILQRRLRRALRVNEGAKA